MKWDNVEEVSPCTSLHPSSLHVYLFGLSCGVRLHLLALLLNGFCFEIFSLLIGNLLAPLWCHCEMATACGDMHVQYLPLILLYHVCQRVSGAVCHPPQTREDWWTSWTLSVLTLVFSLFCVWLLSLYLTRYARLSSLKKRQELNITFKYNLDWCLVGNTSPLTRHFCNILVLSSYLIWLMFIHVKLLAAFKSCATKQKTNTVRAFSSDWGE